MKQPALYRRSSTIVLAAWSLVLRYSFFVFRLSFYKHRPSTNRRSSFVSRLSSLASLVTLSALAPAQARLDVMADGKKAGFATLSQRLLPDGGKLVQLSIELAGVGGRTVRVRSESEYRPDGSPKRMFHETLATNPRSRRQVTVSFDADGANVVEELAGNRTTKQVPLVKAAPIAAPSEFWFVRDIPKPGASVRHYRFDVAGLSWEIAMATYVGPKAVLVGGQKVAGYEIKTDKGMVVVDSKGLPLRLEMGGLVMQRAAAQPSGAP